MNGSSATSPRCIVIAGPNGAGKTTFARTFLPRDAGMVHFVNADLIANGLTYIRRLQRWKRAGYRIDIVFLRLPSARIALRRVAARVKQGGHNVPRADVLRRFMRGWHNFQTAYRHIADAWAIYDNAGASPRLEEKGL